MSFENWIRDNCYETIWVDHQINSNSVVIEFGGYLGRWSKEIQKRYNPNLFVFEPVTEFYDKIQQQFVGNNKVRVINEGVSLYNEEKIIYVNSDSTSVLENSDYTKYNYIEKLVKFRSIDSILEITGKVDLCQINIEGYEYELLTYLISTKKIYNFNKMIIEFHFERDPVFQKNRRKIQEDLKDLGYRQVWNYDWVFECWEHLNIEQN
jgi:FkbM family methyltransferase